MCEILLAVRVEGGVGETLSLVLAKEPTVTEPDVIDLVTRATTVQLHPLFFRIRTFPARNTAQRQQLSPRSKGHDTLST